MSAIHLKFKNLTLAQKAEHILAKNGIRARIIKLSSKGCTHALSVSESDFSQARNVLLSENIEFTV